MHALVDTTCNSLILFTIHPSRKCLICNPNRLPLKYCHCFVCGSLHINSLACISLSSLGLPDWYSKSYLLGTVPGISLWIVQLCRSGMVTEPRHCTQKYPSWNRMQHRFWCGTETNITSKVNSLLNTTQLQGWRLTCNDMSSLLTISICKPQKAKLVCLNMSKNYSYAHRKEQAVHLLIYHEWRSLISFPCSLKVRKEMRNGKKTLWWPVRFTVQKEGSSLLNDILWKEVLGYK